MDPVKEKTMLQVFDERVKGIVDRVYKGRASIKLFGSCVNGFITKTSDMDCGVSFDPDL